MTLQNNIGFLEKDIEQLNKNNGKLIIQNMKLKEENKSLKEQIRMIKTKSNENETLSKFYWFQQNNFKGSKKYAWISFFIFMTKL